MSACTQAKKMLDEAHSKRQKTASSDTGGGAASIQELQAEVQELEHTLTALTWRLGEGKDAEGKWVAELGPRGLQTRCALAALNARGKIPDPHHSSASGATVCI